MKSSLILAAVALLCIVAGGVSPLLAEERLLGYESDEEQVIWECSDIFVGSFTNVGRETLGSAGHALYFDAKVQVTQALKGSLKGELGAYYSPSTLRSMEEDAPVRGQAYVMFASLEGAKVGIWKLLPVTDANVAGIRAFLGQSTPLGDAVRAFIGEYYFRRGEVGGERRTAVEKMIVDHAAEANQLVMHEIFSDPKYRATLGDLRITELLWKTADRDPAGSRQAAQLFKVKLDEDLKACDAAKDYGVFIRSLPQVNQERMQDRAYSRSEAERLILQAKKPDPWPEFSKLVGQMVTLEGSLGQENFGWNFTCPKGRLYLYAFHYEPYLDVRNATLRQLSGYPVRITGVMAHQPALWDGSNIGPKEEHYMMDLSNVKVVPVTPETGPAGK